jgi:hypothetical protein
MTDAFAHYSDAGKEKGDSMYKKIAALTVLILILCVHITFAAPDIKEGRWDITVKMEMPGMPMEMPAVQFTQCLSSQNNIPVNKDELKDCKILSSSTDGNTAKWVMQCSQGVQQITSRGKITYSGDTFNGEAQIQIQGMDITQKMKGRHLGACE